MPSTNSLKKLPINISIYSKVLSNNIFQDIRLTQLLDIANNPSNIYKYQYALYSDVNELKSNIFVPIFHTMMLSCTNNNVFLKGKEDFWLQKIFPNNQYYILKNDTEELIDYASNNIIVIDSIIDMEQQYEI
jgi:hypothetical protein